MHISVLKGVENAGIRFMRGSEEYNALVEKEIKKTRLAKIIRVSSNVMITQKLIAETKKNKAYIHSWKRFKS